MIYVLRYLIDETYVKVMSQQNQLSTNMVRYGIVEINVPLDTVYVISETGALEQ